MSEIQPGTTELTLSFLSRLCHRLFEETIIKECAMTNIFTKRVLDKFATQAPELSDALGHAKMKLEPTMTLPFEMLIRSIVYQQLSGIVYIVFLLQGLQRFRAQKLLLLFQLILDFHQRCHISAILLLWIPLQGLLLYQ